MRVVGAGGGGLNARQPWPYHNRPPPRSSCLAVVLFLDDPGDVASDHPFPPTPSSTRVHPRPLKKKEVPPSKKRMKRQPSGFPGQVKPMSVPAATKPPSAPFASPPPATGTAEGAAEAAAAAATAALMPPGPDVDSAVKGGQGAAVETGVKVADPGPPGLEGGGGGGGGTAEAEVEAARGVGLGEGAVVTEPVMPANPDEPQYVSF